MGATKKFNGDMLQWMRGFYYVATLGNFSAAAREMGINRSAVRHHLHRLEEELDVTLFDRTQDPMQLTAEGAKLLHWSKNIFDTMHNMIRDVSCHDGSEVQGTVTLATQLHIGIHTIVHVVKEFTHNHPKARLDIMTGMQGTTLRRLDSRICDLGICPRPADSSAYEFTPLYSARHLLLARKDMFSISPHPSLEEVAILPLVGFSLDAARPTLTDMFEVSNLKPRHVVVVDSDLLALEYIRAGIGVGFLRENHYLSYRDELEAYPVDSFLPAVEIGMITLKGAYTPSVTRLFMEYCKNNFADAL